MDDMSIGSQMPEVFWDFGSPSPNTWKRCQGSDCPISTDKQDLPKLSLKKKVVKKPRNIFKIDAKSLDKVHSLIAQLGDNDHQENSSLDQLFNQSGGQEGLASSLSGLSSTNENVTNKNTEQPLPAEFWNDDVFTEVGEEKEEKQGYGLSKTSTPLRNQQTGKSLNLKRRHMNGMLSNDTTKSNNLVRLPPEKSTSNGQSKPIENNHAESDSSIDFLVTFNKKNFNRKNASILKSDCKVVRSNSHLVDAVTMEKAVKQNTSKSKKDTSISDEILTQLIMDDSWTVNCTTNNHTVKLNTVTEVSPLDPALTQLLMDDSWNESDVKNNEHLKTETNSHFRNTEKKVQPNVNLNLHTFTSTENCSPFQSSGELEDTLPVSLPFQKKETDGFCDVMKKAHSCHATPMAHSDFFFNPKNSTSPSKVLSTLTHQKCTAAQIEEKRLRALQRKRLRTKSVFSYQ